MGLCVAQEHGVLLPRLMPHVELPGHKTSKYIQYTCIRVLFIIVSFFYLFLIQHYSLNAIYSHIYQIQTIFFTIIGWLFRKTMFL